MIRPILFNTEMVKAILSESKTTTRRCVKPQPKAKLKHKLGYCVDGDKKDIGKFGFASTECGGEILYVAPPARVGDVLWVRESLPKEAARIFLKVTAVRVERLQEIDAAGCLQEGIESEYPHVLNGEEKRYAFSQLWNSTIKKSDIDTYGWDANPWVWVIEFERCEKPDEFV